MFVLLQRPLLTRELQSMHDRKNKAVNMHCNYSGKKPKMASQLFVGKDYSVRALTVFAGCGSNKDVGTYISGSIKFRCTPKLLHVYIF